MKHFILFLSFSILLSCSNKNSTEITEQKAESTEAEIYTELHPNGQIKIKGNLIKNTRQGKWVSYYQDGKTWSETTYLDGKKNGETKSFYPNGNLRFLGHYKDDKKTAQWFFYNENGQFEKEVDFTNK